MDQGIHYIHYIKMSEKLGTDVAQQRCRSAYASVVLSRDFGESVDAFRARNDRAKQLWQFLQDHK